MHTDNKSLSVLELKPYLAGLSFNDPEIAAARDRILTWDAQMVMDSPEAALYNLFWVELLAATFHDQLPEALYPHGWHDTMDAMYFILQDENSIWWDDLRTPDVGERRDKILTIAFEKAVDRGIEELGENIDQWRWGELHTVTFRNPTLGNSGISLIESLFNRGPYATSGSDAVPQKTCWSANQPFEVFCIPMLRQVVDLGELGNSQMILSVGQSGHPMHRHYDDFINPWRFFEYHPNNWERSALESGEIELLRLEPG
jgi:penicillin amidase